ncbi:Fasciclin [Forsythia ovata]|uniref:Fasciclin n=1 Tax=Forsythia ovata TaxID=205694 RepID=A0ABD1P6X3_9LAMI
MILWLPHKVVAEDANGSLKFKEGGCSFYLFDHDIYADGRIYVQWIDGVLFHVEENKVALPKPTTFAKVVRNPRREKTKNEEFRDEDEELGAEEKTKNSLDCHWFLNRALIKVIWHPLRCFVARAWKKA